MTIFEKNKAKIFYFNLSKIIFWSVKRQIKTCLFGNTNRKNYFSNLRAFKRCKLQCINQCRFFARFYLLDN